MIFISEGRNINIDEDIIRISRNRPEGNPRGGHAGGRKKLGKLGWAVKVCRGAGVKAGFSDAQYSEAGAEIADSEAAGAADFVVGVRKPSADGIAKLKRGSFHLSLLDPFNEKALIKAFADAGVTAASFEMIPRSTIAQKWTC